MSKTPFLFHAAFIFYWLCFSTCLSKHRLWPPRLFQGGRGSGSDTAGFKQPETWRSVRDRSSRHPEYVGQSPGEWEKMVSVCIMCMSVCLFWGGGGGGVRGMGISPEGNGITSRLHCISTCQPAEAKERTDSLWRLASTPTSADARHTCMNAHTHINTHTQLDKRHPSVDVCSAAPTLTNMQ